MRERYTDRDRRILELADSAARRFGHPAVHTGHVLMGCIEEEHGLAGKVLASCGLVNAATVTDRLQLRSLPVQEAKDEMQAFDKAAEQWAGCLNHNYQGTEHLLLAMVTLHECQAARSITMQGHSLREIGAEVLAILGHNDIPCRD